MMLTVVLCIVASFVSTWLVTIIDKHIKCEWLQMILKAVLLVSVFWFALEYVAQVI